MRYSSLALSSLALRAGQVLAAPAAQPSPAALPSFYGTINGQVPLIISNPSQVQTQIETDAHGTLPNGPAPPAGAIAPALVQVFKFLEKAELAESYIMQTWYNNVISGAQGFTFTDQAYKAYIANIIRTTLAQELLHAAGAHGIVASQNVPSIAPCTYNFPFKSHNDTLVGLDLVTKCVVGALGEIQQVLVQLNNTALPRLINSISNNEAGQITGFNMLLRDLLPIAEAPFYSQCSGNFAFSFVAQNVINSCPAQGNNPSFDSLTQPNGATPPAFRRMGVMGVSPIMDTNQQTLNFTIDIGSLSKSNAVTQQGSSWAANDANYKPISGKTYTAQTFNQLSLALSLEQNTIKTFIPQNYQVAANGQSATFTLSLTSDFKQSPPGGLYTFCLVPPPPAGKNFADAGDLSSQCVFGPAFTSPNVPVFPTT